MSHETLTPPGRVAEVVADMIEERVLGSEFYRIGRTEGSLNINIDVWYRLAWKESEEQNKMVVGLLRGYAKEHGKDY